MTGSLFASGMNQFSPIQPFILPIRIHSCSIERAEPRIQEYSTCRSDVGDTHTDYNRQSNSPRTSPTAVTTS